MRPLLLVISLLILASCGQQYRSISEFNRQPTALKNKEKIKLIYSLTGEGDNKEGEYYNQLIVVSQETGDTCNILIPVNHGFTETDGDQVFNYFTPDDQTSRLIMIDPEKLAEIKNMDDIEAPSFPRYNKVLYSKKAEAWVRNNYPTVPGFVGTTN